MLLFTDSFDHYSTLLQKWSSTNSNNGSVSISATALRNGAKGLLVSSGGQAWVVRSYGNVVTTISGFACAFPTTGAAEWNWISFNDSGNPQVIISMDNGGVIRAYRGGTFIGGGGTLLGTSSAVGTLSGFHYYEIKLKIDGSVGTIQIKVDGLDVLNLTGLNTKATANLWANQLQIGNGYYNNTASLWVDDVYICDTTGSFNNNFLGDVKVLSQLPTGNGTTTNFTIGGSTPAATHYQSVNENPPDDGVTFVSDGTVGDIDRFTFPAITAASVLAVVVNLRVTKDDATARSVRGAIKSGATVGDTGADLSVTQTTYTDLQGISETDPNTSAAWTTAAVNSAEWGVKVTT